MIYAAITTAIASVALFKYALGFKVDAAPAGSMITLVSVAIAVASVFLFGVSLGQVL